MRVHKGSSGSWCATRPTCIRFIPAGWQAERSVYNISQEELEVPYEIKKYKRTPIGAAPKELLDVHPLGKSPVIGDGDLVLAESGAIIGRYSNVYSPVYHILIFTTLW